MRTIVGQVLEHLTGRVWLYPHDPDPDAVRPSVAVIADDRGSVLIDAGNSPEHARDILMSAATTHRIPWWRHAARRCLLPAAVPPARA
jgi:hypothetical protein